LLNLLVAPATSSAARPRFGVLSYSGGFKFQHDFFWLLAGSCSAIFFKLILFSSHLALVK